MIRHFAALALVLAALTPAYGQIPPPPVPAFPDTARLTSYNLTASKCNCAVGFQLFGDSTDYANWIEVWVNGAQVPQTGNWTISSPTGQLGTIPRPITDAVLTFTTAQTGTVQIVGARRPRRASQFPENRGVAARDLNVAITDVVAENREQWDALLRAMKVPPGDPAVPLTLPSVSTRANKFLGFDANGSPAVFTPGSGSGGNVVGTGPSVANNLPCYNGTSGIAIYDCGISLPLSISNGGTGQTTAPAARAVAGLNIDGYTARGNANYTILATDRTVGTNATFTATRTWTLPAANSVNPGQSLVVGDFFGGVSFSNQLILQRAGSDTINGANTFTMTAAYSRVDLRSDGVSKWSLFAPSSSSGGATAVPKTPMDYGAACDGVADDTVSLQNWLDAIPTAGGGYIPNGRTCLHSDIIYPRSNTTISAYGATIKATASSGNNNKGIFLTDATWLGAGPQNVTILGLTYDGNRTPRNPTGMGPGGSCFYSMNVRNVVFRDVSCLESIGDGFYVGGQGTWSFNVVLDRVRTYRAYRNGCSFVGVYGGTITNSSFEASVGTPPQAGCDLEPDNTTQVNRGIFVSNNNFLGNAGDGFIVVGAGNDGNYDSGASMNNASSNGRYGFNYPAGSSSFRWCGVFGTGNAATLTFNVTDKCP